MVQSRSPGCRGPSTSESTGDSHGDPVTRLLIVGDPTLLMTRVLLSGFVTEARAHPEIELVGLCDAGRGDLASPRNRLRRGLQQATREVFNKGEGRLGPGLGIWKQVAKDNGLPVLTPVGRDLNAPSFREELRHRWRPDAALSLGCLQVWSPELLGIFSTAINFHNGLLPDYRGLNATPWSLYNSEPETGYSFHHMTAGIDEGAVVVDGAFAVPDDANPRAVDLSKCVAAVGGKSRNSARAGLPHSQPRTALSRSAGPCSSRRRCIASTAVCAAVSRLIRST
jgi:hypothetical protein